MNKQEFLRALKIRLSGLPRRDIEEHLNFYAEVIDDRVEDGCSEAEAVSNIGSVEAIARQIIANNDTSIRHSRGEAHPRRIGAWWIVLLVLGSPVWLSLAIAAFAVILSLYAVIWSLVISLWAVFASLIACVAGGVIAGTVFVFTGNTLIAATTIAAALVCAGFAIFLFFACKAATKGSAVLGRIVFPGVKKCLVKKEG